MILRRFMSHVTDQNWFAVGLDVIVVITGIFLGMQVTEWNEDRKDDAAAERYLERIYQDQIATLAPLQITQNALHKNTTTLRHISNYLGGKTLEKPSAEQLNYSLCRWFIPASVKINKTAYDELVSTGRLGLIRDENLRKLIQENYNEHDRVAGDFAMFGSTIKEKAILLSPYIEWYIIPEAEIIVASETNSGTRCNIDLDGLKNSDEAQSIVAQLYRSQLVYESWRGEQASAIMKVIDYMNSDFKAEKSLN